MIEIEHALRNYLVSRWLLWLERQKRIIANWEAT